MSTNVRRNQKMASEGKSRPISVLIDLTTPSPPPARRRTTSFVDLTISESPSLSPFSPPTSPSPNSACQRPKDIEDLRVILNNGAEAPIKEPQSIASKLPRPFDLKAHSLPRPQKRCRIELAQHERPFDPENNNNRYKSDSCDDAPLEILESKSITNQPKSGIHHQTSRPSLLVEIPSSRGNFIQKRDETVKFGGDAPTKSLDYLQQDRLEDTKLHSVKSDEVFLNRLQIKKFQDFNGFLRLENQRMKDNHALKTREILKKAREGMLTTNIVLDRISPFNSLSSIQVLKKKELPYKKSIIRSDIIRLNSNKKAVKHSIMLAAKHVRGSGTPRVPKYQSHTMVGLNILTPDDENFRYFPYISEWDTKEKQDQLDILHQQMQKDIEQHYNMEGHITGRESERASRLRLSLDTWLQKLDIGCDQNVLKRYILSFDNDKLFLRKKHAEQVLWWLGGPLDEKTQNLASLFCKAFYHIFEYTLEELLFTEELSYEMLEKAKETANTWKKKVAERLTRYSNLICLVCASMDCQTHGEFYHDELLRSSDSEDDAEAQEWGKKYNQEIRYMALPYDDMTRQYTIRMAKKKHEVRNSELTAEHGEPCGEECFKLVDFSHQSSIPLDELIHDLPELLLTYTDKNHRACDMSFAYKIPCWQVQKEINIYEAKNGCFKPVLPKELCIPVVPPTWYDNKRKLLKTDWMELTNVQRHEQNFQGSPCKHKGHCTENCPCFQANILCENFCSCPDDCPRRFTGCRCILSGFGSTCTSDSCICIRMNRECGPECGNCGAVEKLHPDVKPNSSLFKIGCQNISLQLGFSKKTILGESTKCDGFGLFAGEQVKKGQFLGEYRGEIITSQEAERRGIINEAKTCSFLFDVNCEYVIDAAFIGNKTRFMNHASEIKDGLNCEAKVMLVNGAHRIKFIALRDIAAGDELLFNYGEKFVEKQGLR